MEAKLSFLESAIWRPNSFGMDNATTKASMTRLMLPAASNATLCPDTSQVPAIVLSQFYSTGEQNTNASHMTEMRYKAVTSMTP